MLKFAATGIILTVVITCCWVAPLCAEPQCVACKSEKDDPVRDAIRAERARDEIRRANESVDRPWDHKDFGRAQRPDQPLVVH